MLIEHKTAKKTKKNFIKNLLYKKFSILVIPYNGKYHSKQWHLSLVYIFFIIIGSLTMFGFIVYASQYVIKTNYKIAQLDKENAAKKQFILNYEDKLRNFLVEYAPKKSYIDAQNFYLPGAKSSETNNNFGIGGNEIAWNKDNTVALENFYEKQRKEALQSTVDSRNLVEKLNSIQPILEVSNNNTQQLSSLFRKNKTAISMLPLTWPIGYGLGEISQINSKSKVLQINTLPGSNIYASGNGMVKKISFNKNVATITLKHNFGITSVYIGVVSPQVSEGQEVNRKTLLGSSLNTLGYRININGIPISAKSLSFLRY